jgi:alginate O-acetyltransferase complex protein AlgI
MAFSNITFLFIFLPVFLLFYFILPHVWMRNLILLIASIIFYAWADAKNVWLVFFLTLINYGFGIISKSKPGLGRWYQVVFVIIMGLNLAPLVYFKYAAFFLNTFNRIFQLAFPIPAHSLPIGLSFLTFCCLSYVLDVDKGTEKPEYNLLAFSNYVAFFPKLAQGPIARFSALKADFHDRTHNIDQITRGIKRFIAGFAKKVLLADSIAAVADLVFKINPEYIGAGIAWYGLIGYGLQIYFDFSGYTDMAIGLGQIIGFNLPENFNYPYFSRSITDFWRRWHMTLTAWFRTYVFIPLEYKRKYIKYFRQSTNILIVFALTGFWHAANWNFILWGLYFGFILSLESLGLGKLLKKTPSFFQHAYTLLIVFIGWIFFRLTDLNEWVGFFKTLFGSNGLVGIYTARSLNILAYWPVYAAAILLCLPLGNKISAKLKDSRLWQVAEMAIYFALFFFSTSMLLSRGYQSFLYAQF